MTKNLQQQPEADQRHDSQGRDLKRTGPEMTSQIDQQLHEVEEQSADQHGLQDHWQRRIPGCPAALRQIDTLERTDQSVRHQHVESEDADHHCEQIEPPPDPVGRHQVENRDPDMPFAECHESGRQHPCRGAKDHDDFENPLGGTVENVAGNHFPQGTGRCQQIEITYCQTEEPADMVHRTAECRGNRCPDH